MNGVFRCSCCGRTNSRELIAFEGQYTRGPFYKDTQSKLDEKICSDCLQFIEETNEVFTENYGVVTVYDFLEGEENDTVPA